MPCDSIATAQAVVSNETLAALLTGEVVAPLLSAYLSELGITAQRPVVTGVRCTVSTTQGTVTVDAGRVSVTTYDGDPRAAEGLAGRITAFLTLAAGRLLQRTVADALAAVADSYEAVELGSGALVINLEVG